MPPRPRRPARPPAVPSAERASPEWSPLAGPASSARDGSGAAPPPLTLSAHTAVEAAHGGFRDALRDLIAPVGAAAAAAEDLAAAGADPAPEGTDEGPLEDAPDRWADEGGPLGALYAGAHRLSAAERDAWEAREFARDRVGAAAGAYARALRGDGVGLPAALVAVRWTVAIDAAGLPGAAYAALQREAARCCLEAFYAH